MSGFVSALTAEVTRTSNLCQTTRSDDMADSISLSARVAGVGICGDRAWHGLAIGAGAGGVEEGDQLRQRIGRRRWVRAERFAGLRGERVVGVVSDDRLVRELRALGLLALAVRAAEL